ncbi:hypothetical protein N0V90_003534 [Kalmusia sp. IMI 367209]|nr:hypothetical protein N0V90_003534 [Kalmusia sp. IMI 367209]
MAAAPARLQVPPSADPRSKSLYKPLPGAIHFRLLKIYPGKGTEAIRCKFKAAAIDDVIDTYEAISYVWGDPNITESIVCNGLQVAVTTNLADALRSFRLPKAKRIVWADAICINQQDTRERSSQVKMMDQVYEKAKRVIAWLGRDLDGIAQECFDLIINTNEYLDDFYLQHGDDGHPSTIPPLPNPLPYTMKENAGYTSIFDLLDLWMPTGVLLDLFMDIHAHYKTKISWRYALPLIEKQSSAQSQGKFLTVLETARFMRATNPRDHIYAFLGSPLAKKANGALIVDPNYDVQVGEVYLGTACALLQNEREAPWLLGYVERKDRESLLDRSSPSWVPIWNQPIDVTNLSHPNHWYKAGGTARKFDPVVDLTSKTLQVSACVFDKIAWLSDIIEDRNLRFNPHFWSDSLRASGKPLIDLLWEDVSAFKTVDENDFTLTIVSEYPTNKSGNMSVDHREDFASYRQHVRAMMANSDDQIIRNASENQRLLSLEHELRGCMNRRLAVTQKGRLSLVPGATTQVSDVCGILLGVNYAIQLLAHICHHRSRYIAILLFQTLLISLVLTFSLYALSTTKRSPPHLQTRAWGGFDQRPLDERCYKQERVATLLAIFLGVFGADQWYAHHWVLAIFKMLTFGGLTVWSAIDAALWVVGGYYGTPGCPGGSSKEWAY